MDDARDGQRGALPQREPAWHVGVWYVGARHAVPRPLWATHGMGVPTRIGIPWWGLGYGTAWGTRHVGATRRVAPMQWATHRVAPTRTGAACGGTVCRGTACRAPTIVDDARDGQRGALPQREPAWHVGVWHSPTIVDDARDGQRGALPQREPARHVGYGTAWGTRHVGATRWVAPMQWATHGMGDAPRRPYVNRHGMWGHGMPCPDHCGRRTASPLRDGMHRDHHTSPNIWQQNEVLVVGEGANISTDYRRESVTLDMENFFEFWNGYDTINRSRI
ncbi:MAG: hypothetical protein KatS3mg055_2879 [Chloroflexus sp.]|nr:MAG: hypothetical protein KatS3mg055_2879 [Chloroflexus sp.]